MKRRTIREAVIETLKRRNKSLSSRDIYNYIIENDLYRFNAEHPEGIVKVAIRRHCEGVDFPSAKPNKYFRILLDGTYWLKDLPVPGQSSTPSKAEILTKKTSDTLKSVVTELKEIHAKHTEAFKEQLLHKLKEIPPKLFEEFGKKLLEIYGFEQMQVTSYSKDGGIDGYGKLKVGITYLDVSFQCKRWKSTSVGRVEIDRFRGAIQGMFEQGIIFTTSNFSKDALNATRRNGAVPIILIDGATLVEIMIEKRFGVATENMTVFVNVLEEIFNED